MKRLILLLAVVMVSCMVSAQTFTADGICYFVTNGSEVSVEKNEENPYSGNIVIPDMVTYNGRNYKVTTIGYEAFRECDITTIKLPSTLLKINGMAFYGCKQLESLTIPASVKYIANDCCFCYLDKVDAIVVEKGNTSFTTVDGILYTYDVSELVYYPEGKTDRKFTMPETVVKTWNWSCTGLPIESIEFSKNLRTIGRGTFSSCWKLKSITLPEGITDLAGSSFRYCYNLKEVNLPSTLQSIGGEALWGARIEEITIPAKVSTIGVYAFYRCGNLKKLKMLTVVPPTINNSTFESDDYDRVKVVVPEDGYADYKSDPTWSKFTHIETTTFFRLSASEHVILQGESWQLPYICSPDLEDKPMTWRTSNPEVATVSNGLVTAVSLGTATITATCDGRESSCLITVTDKLPQTVVWGYCDDFVGEGVGNGENMPIKCAILLPATTLQPYKGALINKIEVGLSTSVSGLVPVIDEGDGVNKAEQPEKPGRKGWNEITLVNPYVIGDSPLYVGYSCIGTWSAALSGVPSVNGSYIFNNGYWNDYSGNGWGAFCVRLHIEGNDLPIDVRMTFDEVLEMERGDSITKNAIVTNLSPEPVHNLSIIYYINGTPATINNVNVDIAKGSSAVVPVKIVAPNKSGSYNTMLEVVTVNGASDELSDNSRVMLPLTIMGKTYPRRVVFEEGTGTWCGWCVRGYVGMQEMAEKYPEDFIGIAIHNDDEMANHQNYNSIFNLLGGSFPSCIVNRNTRYAIDPNFNDMERVYLELRNNAKATINGKIYTQDDNEILIQTESEFGFVTTDQYNIAYVVVENEVGPYLQANFYSGSGTVMRGFENQGRYVSLVFNDVARGIFNGFKGNLSYPPTIKEGVIYRNEYRLKIPSNVDDKSNIEVIALLIDNKTGEIINACKCSDSNDMVDSITDTEFATPQVVEIHDVNGMKLNKMGKGVNILRMSDNSTRKIIRK